MTEAPTWDRPADRLRQSAEDAYARIRGNTVLGPDAQQALVAEAYLNTQRQMTALQDQSGQATAATIDQLKRTLFGVDDIHGDAATIAIAFRDAADRVARADNPAVDLPHLLEQAELAGDETMAQAVFNAAATNYINQFTDIVDAFLSTRPAKRQAYDTLMQAERTQISDMWEFVLPKPPELNNLTDTQISLAAQRADEIRRSVRI